MNNHFDIHKHLDILLTDPLLNDSSFIYFKRVIEEWRDIFSIASREARKPAVAKIKKTTGGEEAVKETYQHSI